jgi:hypothetical protein
MHEIAVDGIERMYADDLLTAIEACRDEQRVTYLTENGRRVAAICPPEWVLAFGAPDQPTAH